MTATIEARGLTKHFGKTAALDGLDLIAPAGHVVAVLGPERRRQDDVRPRRRHAAASRRGDAAASPATTPPRIRLRCGA